MYERGLAVREDGDGTHREYGEFNLDELREEWT